MNEFIERLGWVLVHSLWQFALMALLAGVISRAMRRSSSAARYGVHVMAMGMMVVAPLMTWLVLSDTPRDDLANRVALAPGPDAVQPASPGANATRLASATTLEDPTPDDVTRTRRAGSVSPPVMETSFDSETTGGLTPPARRDEVAFSLRIKAALRPWLAWIVVGWSLGAVMCSLRPLLGWHTLHRLQRVGASPVSDDVLAAMRRVSERLGLSRAVRVLQSTLAQVPVVVGYMRPVILLPVSLMTSIPAAQLEAILAHELAHVRRHDFVVNLLQTLIETLFFYHPAVWWLSRQIRVEREHCCDDLVVTLLGNRVEYGRALLAIEELRGASTVLALGATDGSLLSRIRRIVSLGSDHASNERWPAALIGLALIGATCALSMTWSLAAKDDAKKEPQPAIARLPDDVTVELVGVTYQTSTKEPDSRWWTPSGSPLADGRIEQDRLRHRIHSPHSLPDENRVFVTEVRGLSETASIRVVISSAEKPKQGSFNSVDRTIRNTGKPDVTNVTAAGPLLETSRATVRVRLATDDWGPVQEVSTSATRINELQLQPDYARCYDKVGPQRVREVGSNSHFTLTWPQGQYDLALQEVWAVDKDGKRLDDNGTAGAPTGLEFSFALPLDQIARFEYRLRPFRHLVTFENVSLQPGQQTDLKVKVESLPAVAKFLPPNREDVRGLDLSRVAVRGYSEATRQSPDQQTPELLVPDPANPGSWKQPKNLFQMPLAEHTWLKYPAGSGHFYIEHRSDGTWQSEQLFGPIEGDPFEMLKLEELFRERLKPGATAGDPRYRLRLMFHTGNSELMHRAWRLIEPELASKFSDRDEGLFGRLESLEIVREALRDEAAALLKPEMPKLAARMRAAVSVAESSIDARNDSVPDDQYGLVGYLQPKIAAKIPDVLWGQPLDGLRLALVPREFTPGIDWNELPLDTPLPTSVTVEPGHELAYQLVVENVSDHEIKLCGHTSGEDTARSLEVFDHNGKPVATNGLHTTIPSFLGYWRLKPGERQLFSMPAVHFLPESHELPNHRLGYSVQSAPGKYSLRCNMLFGNLDNERHRHVPGQSEWIGKLTTGTQTITFDVARAGRGSRDPALDPTAGLPNSDEETNPPNNANGDLRSNPAAGSGDPRRAQIATQEPTKTTRLDDIIQRLMKEEQKYNRIEVIVRSHQQPLKVLNNETQEIEIVRRLIRDHDRSYYLEESFCRVQETGTTSLIVHEETIQGRWWRQRIESNGPGAAKHSNDSLFVLPKPNHPLGPHTLSLGYWLDRPESLSDILTDETPGRRKIIELLGEEPIGKERCLRLKEHDVSAGGSKSYRLIWLALDKNLLPVRSERCDKNVERTQPLGFTQVTEWLEVQPGIWFPKCIEVHQTQKTANGTGNLESVRTHTLTVELATLQPQFKPSLFDKLGKPPSKMPSQNAKAKIEQGFSEPEARDTQAAAKAAPPEGLAFLKPYPKLHGLSLDMTEPQFLEIVKLQELKTRKTVDGEKVTHHIALGDDHTLIVMFDKDAKCSGIQRVRGEDDVPARPKAVLGRESFKGRVMIDGAIPATPPLKVRPGFSGGIPRNDEEERKAEERKRKAVVVEVPDDSLVISKDGGLADVAIYLKKAPANWKPTGLPSAQVELRSADRRFQPRISFVRVGQPLRLIAPKNEADNFLVMPIRSNTFNILVPADSQRDVAQPFTKSEPVPIEVKSNLHSWQRAFLLALDHPFAAITDADGRFEIRDLPAGEHHFTVWHERRGYLNKDLVVRVEDGKVTAVDLKYTVEQLSPTGAAPPIQKPDGKSTDSAGKLQGSAEPVQGEIMVGEPTWLAFKVTNKSETNRRMIVGGDYRNRLGRPESFSVEVLDSHGRKVSQPDAGGTMGGISVTHTLKANGESSEPFELFLPHWATITQPGRYRIAIRRRCELVPDDGSNAFGAKTEKVEVAAETTINVIPADAAQFGELIERLGTKLLGEDSAESERASKMLKAMHDERIVPWFVKLLDQPSGQRKLLACDALGQYGSDAAFAALQRAMKTTSAHIGNTTTQALTEESADQVHYSAALALAKCPHPEAAAFLLTQTTDRNWSVRITVLRFAATLKTKEARDVIERLTKDENEDVRNEALRSLKEAELKLDDRS